jgi:hypothetical protein
VTRETGEGANKVETTYKPNVPEFVYFFGGGIAYRISKYTSLSIDLAIRQCQTDRLDDYITNGDFDYYSYLSIGITIEVGRIINPFLKTRYTPKKKY